jgi:hypothetical protein
MWYQKFITWVLSHWYRGKYVITDKIMYDINVVIASFLRKPHLNFAWSQGFPVYTAKCVVSRPWGINVRLRVTKNFHILHVLPTQWSTNLHLLFQFMFWCDCLLIDSFLQELHPWNLAKFQIFSVYQTFLRQDWNLVYCFTVTVHVWMLLNNFCQS